MLQSAPTVHKHENRNGREPEIPAHKCPDNETGDSDESQNRCHHQASRAPQDKPEKGAKNLTTVQGIDRENVEDEQADINSEDGTDQFVNVRQGIHPSCISPEDEDRIENWSEGYVYERAGSDTPQGCSRARRRIDICHTTQRPQHDSVGLPTNLAACQGVTKFMQQHNQKEAQILDYIPGNGGIAASSALDFINGNQKP